MDPILHRIISKLDLSAKFGVQGVCRHWKNIAIDCLRWHPYLVISEDQHICFGDKCDEHLSLIKKNNLICGKQTNLKFWKRTLSLLQAVKYVYIDLYTHDENGTSCPNYKSILQLLFDSCGQSLECLCIPNHKDYEDETFPLTDSLPSLKHLLLGHTTSQVTKNILSVCPNLEYLKSSTSFTEWQMLPKGFKKLQSYSGYFHGINNLFSPATMQSLEVVDTILVTSEICYQSYPLSCLKRFHVTIDFPVTSCLTHLAWILSFAPVLRQLQINILVFDEIQSQAWIKVLSSCQTLTNLTVYLREPMGTENPRINVSLFQDDFVKTIVSQVKKLKILVIYFHLSSDGLRLLSKLENLNYFFHQIHTENMSYDSVFDTDALTDFLSLSFDKTLTNYRINIPRVKPLGEYLILKESFYDFIEKMERKHFLRFEMCQNDRHYHKERVHFKKIPGMIYVTRLHVYEWDLMYPSLDNTEKDEL